MTPDEPPSLITVAVTVSHMSGQTRILGEIIPEFILTGQNELEQTPLSS